MEEENRTEEQKKWKKTWAENEAPFYRWIMAAVLGIAGGIFIGGTVGGFVGSVANYSGIPFLVAEKDMLQTMAVFAVFYWGLALAIRVFCRTSMRAFFFGRGRRPDWKGMALIGLLYLVGITLAQLIAAGNITWDHQSVMTIIGNFILCALLVWMQTSTEEIIFRGIFIRMPYKNEMPGVAKGTFAAVISSLLFMSGHLYNPEVTTQSGSDMIVAASVYFISGLLLFVSNLLVGDMGGALAIHLVNNFFCFFFVRTEVTALNTPAMFVDHTQEHTGLMELIGTLIAYLPVYIFLVLRYRKVHRESDQN